MDINFINPNVLFIPFNLLIPQGRRARAHRARARSVARCRCSPRSWLTYVALSRARACTQLRGVTFKTRTLLKDTDGRRVVAATVAQQSNMRKTVPVMHPMEENHPRFFVVI